MAASSKPTAVHFSLVFFVMTTLILALVCYLVAKESSDRLARAERAADELATANTALNRALDEMKGMKRLLGYEDAPTVGLEGDDNPDSLRGRLTQALLTYGRDSVQPSLQSPNVDATLRSLRSALNTAMASNQQAQENVEAMTRQLEEERSTHVNRASELQTSQESSEEQLSTLVATRNEQLAEKDQEIDRFRRQFQTEQREKESLQDELAAVRQEKDEQIAELERIVRFMRQQLDELEDMSFDVADGVIRRVDNTTRTVWINLGSQDNLREQVTFSVYQKNHDGFGRGRADIKAKIEVTKIRGPKLAEARIIDEDISRPIQAGDPIYSPAWTKGGREYFSFVGILDMNGDGVSDRQQLHNVLDNAGARVEVEVNDLGQLVPEDGTLTEKTKYLVVGEIPDPTQFPGSDVEKQEQIQAISNYHEQLTREALRKGIKIVRFRDFLNYMGYEPQQQLYIPQESGNFTLKHGARSASTRENINSSSRFSTGNTSARFQGSNRD